MNSAVLSTNGQGHGALAGMLREIGLIILICGGIGGGARKALQEAGIRLYAGVSGDADRAVDSLLAGTLVQNAEATCDHPRSRRRLRPSRPRAPWGGLRPP